MDKGIAANARFLEIYPPDVRSTDPGMGNVIAGAHAHLNAHFQVSAPANVTAGSPVVLTVTALDLNNHPLPDYTGTVQFTSTDGAATLPVSSSGPLLFTAGAPAGPGARTFVVTLRTGGSQTIRVTDAQASPITGSATVSVAPAAASRLAILGLPSSATAGAGVTFTVTALDPYGNRATGYQGTLHFSSTDVQAALPANYTFTTADAGVHTFHVRLRTAGRQTLTVTDTAIDSLLSRDTVTVT